MFFPRRSQAYVRQLYSPIKSRRQASSRSQWERNVANRKADAFCKPEASEVEDD